MALTEHYTTPENITIALWKPEESETELILSLGSRYAAYADELKKIQSARRRIEFLTVRLLVQFCCGNDKLYSHDDHGAPILTDRSYCISVSHTEGCIALARHPDKPVGLDVERISSRILRVGQRFLSPAEQEAISPARELRDSLLVWSAKESLFKMIGCTEVDFKKHLHVDVSTLNQHGEGILKAWQTRTEPVREYQIRYKCYPGFVLTLCTEFGTNL